VLDGAGGIVRSVASDAAPGVVDAVDVDEIVRRIDIRSVVHRWVDRVLRRDSSSPPGGPRLLVHSASEAASS
jgi:transposase-like protein